MVKLYERKEDCCGCGACAASCPHEAIQMLPDEEGFLYPNIDAGKCTECKRCQGVCDFQKRDEEDPLLHEPLAVWAVRHKNDEVLYNSSSGGVFTGISDLILEKNGVVFGAVYDENMRVRHTSARTAEERDAMRGSKYVQSALIFTEGGNIH